MSKFNALIEGPIGSGKTSGLRTVTKELLIIATEPGIEAILGEDGKYPTDPEMVHWVYCPPATVPWEVMIDTATKVNQLNQEQIAKMNFSKQEYGQFIDLLNICANYKCQRCGKEFGPIDNLSDEYVVAIDGLSGLNKHVRNLIVGAKSILSQAEWQIAQHTLRSFIDRCTNNLKASFILIAHVEKEYNELTGGTVTTVSTLGKKLAPDIPKFFDEVIFAWHEGEKFWWSTTMQDVDLKSRRLPLSDKIEPDFGKLMGG